MSQQMSFDFEAGPRAAPVETKRRLNGQCGRILYRLRQGPATNVELAEISLKYTARISDLRKTHDVRCTHQDKKTGIARYSLFENGREVRADSAARAEAEGCGEGID